MNKQELIEMVRTMPEDIEVFVAKEGPYNDTDIRVFTEPKPPTFYDWYFGP